MYMQTVMPPARLSEPRCSVRVSAIWASASCSSRSTRWAVFSSSSPGPVSVARRGPLPLALRALARMAHRGGTGGDGQTGDGAGVLTQIPWPLLLPEFGQAGLQAQRPEQLGIGALFLPRGQEPAARALLEHALAT